MWTITYVFTAALIALPAVASADQAAGWDGEVAKIIKASGAPIDDADAKAIKEYLSKNYAG